MELPVKKREVVGGTDRDTRNGRSGSGSGSANGSRASREAEAAAEADTRDQRGLARYITGGGTTSYDIGGLHAIALLLSLWALYRRNPCAGECALWAAVVALASREWIGGPATLPSASLRVPLLHDPCAVRAEEMRRKRCSGGEHGGRGAGGGLEGSARGIGGVAGVGGGVGGGEMAVCLLGASVEIVEVVRSGPSGFDRLCVKVRVAELVSCLVLCSLFFRVCFVFSTFCGGRCVVG